MTFQGINFDRHGCYHIEKGKIHKKNFAPLDALLTGNRAETHSMSG